MLWGPIITHFAWLDPCPSSQLPRMAQLCRSTYCVQIRVHSMQILLTHYFMPVIPEVGSRIYCAACQTYSPSVDVSDQLSSWLTPSRCWDSCLIQGKPWAEEYNLLAKDLAQYGLLNYLGSVSVNLLMCGHVHTAFGLNPTMINTMSAASMRTMHLQLGLTWSSPTT